MTQATDRIMMNRGLLAAPLAALRVADPLRHLLLSRVLPVVAEAEAEVLVVDLEPGEKPPVAPTQGCALLVLSDDPAVLAMPGLAGVLPRSASAAQVAAAAAALGEGLSVRPRGAEAPARPSRLTPREAQILALVDEGLSNKAIARRLSISAHTVKYHLEAVFAKLGVRSRAEAVGHGHRAGYLAG